MAFGGVFIILIQVVLCYPAWLFAKNRQGASVWSLFLAIPGVLLWVLFTAFGIGAQSLSNIIEVLFLVSSTILLYYIKVFALDKTMLTPRLNTILITSLLCLFAMALRVFMPSLPE
jgi:hypothetical protein